jgi:hypothetical protein
MDEKIDAVAENNIIKVCIEEDGQYEVPIGMSIAAILQKTGAKVAREAIAAVLDGYVVDLGTTLREDAAIFPWNV